MADSELNDRFLGCLLGLAIGDALLSGAYLGAVRLPSRLVSLLESSPKGRAYLVQLSEQLLAVYLRGRR